ncbi:MAG: leucyl aminopeptidase [Cohaesibacter sp.]|jgi:leucyl aminopeptidase|nr:leucyl aminopeptidase [Cohaesibacter sp.]
MTQSPVFNFHPLTAPKKGNAVLLIGKDLELGSIGRTLDEASDGAVGRAIKAADFKGELNKTLVLLAPSGSELDRIILLGIGDDELSETDWLHLGGAAMAAVKGFEKASLILDLAKGDVSAASASLFTMGMKLRAYDFDKYKTEKGKKPEEKPALSAVIQVAEYEAAQEAWQRDAVVSDGTLLARDLVNEPANVLGPEEFAAKAKALEELGAEVEILEQAELEAQDMWALLGVAQGSVRGPRVAVIKWNGGKEGDAPIAFIGKGVVFDTGGISIKPAGGMEDMKGDMGGAAAVTGLMHALVARKAKVNVIGAIGLVENMPDGNAQRPGDIVTSKSGQTIEVINTDAEGRLVLADVLTYIKETYEPRFMIDLATLTGAVLVALGNQNAGIFSNSDEMCAQLSSAGEATGETVWRLPLSKEYDKMIDSTFADMKNTGGRWAGSITAAQFLKRFVGETDWVHIDVAGTAMGSPKNEINQSWASGYGVRLLDRLVADNYEA